MESDFSMLDHSVRHRCHVGIGVGIGFSPYHAGDDHGILRLEEVPHNRFQSLWVARRRSREKVILRELQTRNLLYPILLEFRIIAKVHWSHRFRERDLVGTGEGLHHAR